MIKWISIFALIALAAFAAATHIKVAQLEAQGVVTIAEKDEVIEYLRARKFELEAREKGWEKFCRHVQFDLGVLDKEPAATGQGGH